MAESEAIAGRKATFVGDRAPMPKKARDVPVPYPKRDTPTKVRGPWVGEALIGVNGKILKLWVLREPQLEPAWPEFSSMVASVIAQWEYEPLRGGKKARPVCLGITVNFR